MRRACLGGFPAVIHASDDEARQAWCDEYLSLMLQKDIQRLAQIENVVHMPQLIQILAARTGTLVNYSSFASECTLSTTTLKRYMGLLQSLFLVHTLPAWSLNIGKRFVKSPKVYFVDTALLLAALRFDKERLFESPLVLGKVVGNFVVNEIMKQVTWASKQVRVFHCRFQDNRSEVDLILEDGRGKVVAIEIKASETVGTEDFRHFGAMEEAMGNRFHRGIILYAGSHKLPFGERRWALPISSLCMLHSPQDFCSC